ncbi:T9SS C-terminal target domain-containing protein [Sphingobacteriales bacterium UPWRP_1]|nr:hypothetical protein BVG80_15815 [Sphingobacteriales bacterium TSM_CSM]PSJ75050.1 T9SS C-terminal target domain-containing protein [Sphingobacteriales bacterium UPWRP_1]
MYRLATLVFLLFCALNFNTFAQPYNNEWINNGQTYVKITVPANGLYQIPQSALLAAGLPNIGSGFQLFRNGQQVPLYITSEGVMTGGDYIEFIGTPNTGNADTPLFNNPDDQLNPARSLFTDTAAYFLTWNNLSANLRYQNTPNNLTAAPPAETFFWQTSLWTVNNQFNPGLPFDYQGNTPLRFAGFDPCEGFTGTNIATGATQTYNLLAPDLYEPATVNAQVSLKVVGRSDDPLQPNDHTVTASVNGTPYATTTYNGFNCATLNFEAPLPALFGGGATLSVTSGGTPPATDVNAVAWYRLQYPHSFSFGGASFFSFTLQDNTEKYLEISNFNGGDTPVLYDQTNNLRLQAVQEGGLLKFKLPQGSTTATPRNLCLVNTNPNAIALVNTLQPFSFNNFNSPLNQGNFVIIAHPALAAGATNAVEAYANYRRSAQGGSYTVQVAYIDELYNQFAFGIAKHPLSIRNFINYALDNWVTPPQYVLLLGKGITYNQTTFNANAFNANLVPTFGVPASDALLATRSNTDTAPQVAIGRIPAATPADVQAYLNKLMQYETTQTDFLCSDDNFWRKDILHLAQGDTGEVDLNSSYLYAYQQLLENNNGYGGRIKGSFANNKFGSLNFPEIEQLINNGVGLVQFTGNANNNGYWLTDINPPQFYQNEGRYPVMLASAGKSGSMYDYSPTGAGNMMADFVLASQSGAVAFMGNTDAVIPNKADTCTTGILAQLNTINYGQSLASSITNAAQTLLPATGTNSQLHYTLQTIALAADPALSPVPRQQPELSLPISGMSFYNPATGFPILSNPLFINSQMPEFEARFVIKNMGRALPDSVDLTVQRILPTGDYLPVITQRRPITVYADTLSLLIPNNLPQYSGFNSFVFTIDGSFETEEDCEFNNTAIVLADMNPYCEIDLGPDELYVLPDAFPLTLSAEGDWITYQWSTGQTTPQITVTDFGTYTLTVTNSFGCVAADAVQVSFNNSIYNANNNTLQITARPNPATDQILVSGVQNCLLQLFSVNGQPVFTQHATTNTAQLSLQTLPPGVYLLKAVSAAGAGVIKVVKR